MKKALVLFTLIAILISFFGFVSTTSKSTLKIGDVVPEFTLKDQNEKDFTLTDFIGKQNMVIYFYPKDDTPGCTKEACRFRDEFEVFTDLEAVVIGISSDSPQSHQDFITKYNLPFTLLTDSTDEARKAFGVNGNYNNQQPGRVTFVIDKMGVIQYVFDSSTEIEVHVKQAKEILVKLNKN